MPSPSSSSHKIAFAIAFSFSFALSSSSFPFLPKFPTNLSLKPFSSHSFPSQHSSPSPSQNIAADLLSLLGSKQDAARIPQDEARQLQSCLRFLIPPASDSLKGRLKISEELKRKLVEENENEMVWWPPMPVMELARLAVDSGGDPGTIQRALDPTKLLVPDVEGLKKDKCELTRTPYAYRFANKELNSYFEFLFELIVERARFVGMNVSLNRYDLFHGHVFLASDSGRLGILFHAREYPAYERKRFPYNLGFCQTGSNVIYDDSMNLRNILWLAPLPSNVTKAWLAPVGKDFESVDESTIIRFLQFLAVPVIGNACHAFMHGLNNIQIYGAEKLHSALLDRPQGKPLVTVSNHVASMDDPLVIASLLPPNAMLDARNIRWTLCATDRCFKNTLMSTFFLCVKVLPVSRGEGIYQKGMDMALSKLNNGGWVHIFPEGSRSRDGGKTIGSVKRGVGRLVMDADKIPIVIPFVHSGMQEIMPIGSNFPKVGKKLTVVVGDPIPLEDLIVDAAAAEDISRGILYDAVSSRISHRLRELKIQADKLALEHAAGLQAYFTRKAEPGYGVWQQVDWEAFGMVDVMQSEERPLIAEPLFADRPDSNSTKTVEMSFCRGYGGGIVSRVRGYMNPTELMGFAASGLFKNGRLVDEAPHDNIRDPFPAKWWKPFDRIGALKAWNRL